MLNQHLDRMKQKSLAEGRKQRGLRLWAKKKAGRLPSHGWSLRPTMPNSRTLATRRFAPFSSGTAQTIVEEPNLSGLLLGQTSFLVTNA